MGQTKQGVALSSVFASFFLTAGKLIVGILTGSIGILSEAAHSALDWGAALITYFAVRVSDRPADDVHHYGHGKIESFSAFVETLLLFATSIWIVYEAIKRLLSHDAEIEVTWYAFVIVIISIIVDYSRSRALKKVAQETKSQALEADALHFSSDIYSSCVVLVGLIFVKFGINGADAIAAIGVSLFVVHAGWQLGKRTVDVLMDTAPKGINQKLETIIKNVSGVSQIDRLRVRPAGVTMFIDLVISVNRNLSLEQTHALTTSVEEKIHEEMAEADVIVHVRPMAPADERAADRVYTIVSNHDLSAHNVDVHEVDTKKSITLDLEVHEQITFEQAHKKADMIEQAIKKEFGLETEVVIHLDPIGPSVDLGEEVSQKKKEILMRAIKEIGRHIDDIEDIHDINIHHVGGQLNVSCHCLCKKGISLSRAHSISHQLKQEITDRIPGIGKVVVHAEPHKSA